MEFKVKKGVSKEPLLWGLKIPQFVIFIAIVIVSALALASGLSVKKILIILSIVGGSFFILQVLSTKNVFRELFSDKFPDSVKNDLF